MYWMLILDSRRTNAYEEAVRQCQKNGRKHVWLDIGTGAHMPLTRLLIKHRVAEHVLAIEADSETYKHAKKLKQSMLDEDKEKISLFACHSSDIEWQTHQSRPDAIIHEIVGTVSSDEGCIKVMHDTINSLNGNISKCIPYRIGTLCIPVSFPKISFLSSLCSLAFLRSCRITRKCGAQPLVNPPKDVLLSEEPELIEKYVSLEDWKKSPDKCAAFETKFVVHKNESYWTGFYLAPHILTSEDNTDGTTEIDGLKHKTSWNINYIHMFDYAQGMKVQKGDEIHIVFYSKLDDICPKYRLEAWVNDAYIQRTAVVWEGSIWI